MWVACIAQDFRTNPSIQQCISTTDEFSITTNGDHNCDAHAGTDQSGKSIYGAHKGFRLPLLLS